MKVLQFLKKNVIFICILSVVVVLGFFAYRSEKANIFSKYSIPICKEDKVFFVSDTCDKCKSDIKETGVMFELENTKKSEKFSDYFKNYADYNSKYKRYSLISYSFFCSLLVLFIYFVVKLIKGVKRKRLKKSE